MKNVLEGLLTSNELGDAVKRLQIVKLLPGGVPQRQIADQLEFGISTVSRGFSVLRKKTGGVLF
jgi:Trp operon repressor